MLGLTREAGPKVAVQFLALVVWCGGAIYYVCLARHVLRAGAALFFIFVFRGLLYTLMRLLVERLAHGRHANVFVWFRMDDKAFPSRRHSREYTPT